MAAVLDSTIRHKLDALLSSHIMLLLNQNLRTTTLLLACYLKYFAVQAIDVVNSTNGWHDNGIAPPSPFPSVIDQITEGLLYATDPAWTNNLEKTLVTIFSANVSLSDGPDLILGFMGKFNGNWVKDGQIDSNLFAAAWSGADKDRVRRFASAFTPNLFNHINAISDNSYKSLCYLVFGYLLPYIPQKSLEKIDNAHIETMLQTLNRSLKTFTDSEWQTDTMKAALKSKAVAFKSAITNYNNDLKYIPVSGLSILLSSKDACKQITMALFVSVADDEDYAAKIPADCVAEFTDSNIWSQELQSNETRLGNLPKSFFSKVPHTAAMHESWFKGITKEQVTDFQSGIKDKSKRYANFLINAANNAALEALTPAAMATIVASSQSRPISLVDGDENGWDHLEDKIFVDIVKRSNFVSILQTNIDSSQWKMMKTAQIAFLFEAKKFCQKPPHSSIFEHHTEIAITAQCFAQMPAESQSSALQNLAKVPREIFQNGMIDHRKVQKWEVTNDDHTYTHLAALEGIQNNDDVVEILSHMKENEAKYCLNGVPSLSELVEYLPHIRKALVDPSIPVTSACFQAFNLNLSQEDLEMAPELFSLQSMKRILEAIPSLEKITAPTFERLVLSKGSFCRDATAEQWNKIPAELFASIGSSCVGRMKKRGVNKEIFHAMPADAFSEFTAADARLLDLEALPDESFVKLSARLTEGTTFAQSMTQNDVKKLSTERVGKMPARMFAQIPANAYPSFTLDQLKAMKPESMAEMELEQVTNFGPLLKEFSAEQITMVGTQRKEGASDPIAAFASIHESLSQAAKAAYEVRSDASIIMASLFVTIASIAAGFLVAVL